MLNWNVPPLNHFKGQAYGSNTACVLAFLSLKDRMYLPSLFLKRTKPTFSTFRLLFIHLLLKPHSLLDLLLFWLFFFSRKPPVWVSVRACWKYFLYFSGHCCFINTAQDCLSFFSSYITPMIHIDLFFKCSFSCYFLAWILYLFSPFCAFQLSSSYFFPYPSVSLYIFSHWILWWFWPIFLFCWNLVLFALVPVWDHFHIQ